MTARTYPVDAVSGAPSYTGRALRQTLSVLVPGATSARPLGAQSGVRPGTPSTTVSVASSTYTVTPHSGVLDVETAAAAGPYLYAFDANVTGSVNAAHATYTRWDGIYVQLSDPAESDGTANPGVAIVYVAGTASASPAMPTQPARSMLLAKIVVPNSGGGASSVVWMAPSIIDGPPSYAALADLQARNPTAPDGAKVVIGSGWSMAEYVYDGSIWHAATFDTGWLNITVNTAAGFSGTNLPAVRVRNGIAYYKGRISGTFALGSQTIGYPPAIALPSAEELTYCVGMNTASNSQPISLFVTPAGELKAAPSVAGSATVGLAALSYSVD